MEGQGALDSWILRHPNHQNREPSVLEFFFVQKRKVMAGRARGCNIRRSRESYPGAKLL